MASGRWPIAYHKCNIYAMRRTTIFADEKLLDRARKVAERRGVSFAKLVRDALEHYIETPRTPARLPSIAGMFSSGAADTSERVDELLWEDAHP